MKEVREAINGLYDKNGNLIDAGTSKDLVVEKINYMKDVVQAIFDEAKEHGYIDSHFTLETFPTSVSFDEKWEEEMVDNLSLSIHKIAIKLTAMTSERDSLDTWRTSILQDSLSFNDLDDDQVIAFETNIANAKAALDGVEASDGVDAVEGLLAAKFRLETEILLLKVRSQSIKTSLERGTLSTMLLLYKS